jgi:decaprenyl-phosphate phosphoribosyltransferase
MSYFKLLRPHQWIKNVFIFIPLIFAGHLFDPEKFETTLLAAIIFSLVASSMYVLNDILDQKQDSLHPIKKNRPIASGKISTTNASLLLTALIIISTVLIFKLIPSILIPILIYIILNISYSFFLKHIAIVDILLISSFYLIRIITGGQATETFISSWLILSVIFLTLFIIIGKRLAEKRHDNPRKVLKSYSSKLLEQLLTVSGSLTIVTYGIYSILGTTSQLAVYSIFLVLLGLFRYFQLIYTNHTDTENPELLLFKDPIILLSVLGWLGFMGYIFYLT